jgi:hypothetical protein
MTSKVCYALILVILASQAFGQGDSSLDLPVDPKAWEGYRIRLEGRAPPPEPPPRADEPFQDGPEYVPIFGQDFPVGKSVVFVLDKSSSMDYPAHEGEEETRWERLQKEVTRAIKALGPDQKFSIVEFTCSHRVLWRSLRKATKENKKLAISWLMKLEPSWSTGTGPAVVAGLWWKPDGVILVTDGAPNCGLQPGEHRDMIRRYNKEQIRIDVIGIGVFSYTRAWCQQIASQNGGFYHDVP